ncbi:hypothetical protein BX600DRAFT_521505 [Xylariales sp. PMI_506]|nr:hypothetical protein BX600DRAFT_521505 [Xylariales sp. PMI_506]
MSSSDDNRGPQVQAAASAMFAIALIALLLRCYVRIGIMKAFSVDDWFMVAAMVSFTFNTATCLAGVAHGTGQHATDLTAEDFSKAMMFWWYCYLTYCTSMILSKTSIACFLLRIATSRVHRWIIYISLGLTIFCSTAFFFIAMFQCHPVSYFWTRTGDGGCISVDVIIDITYTYSSLAILTDFTFTFLPIWLIMHLQMDRKTKIALIPILSMATIASCAVAVRLSYVQDFKNPDFLWATAYIATWSQTEQGLAIAAGCLVTLKPLFRMALSRLGFTQAGSTGAPGSSARYGKERTGNSSYSVKSPNRLFSLSNFTKMDDVEDSPYEPDAKGTEQHQGIPLEATTQDSFRRQGHNNPDRGYEYRIAIRNPRSDAWNYPIQGVPGQQDPHSGRITKETSVDVTSTHNFHAK